MERNTTRFEDARAVVFDAYGTLFDVASAAELARDQLGDHAPALSEIWRAKQLQYTWLRSLLGRHADFEAVTADALDFALESLGLAEPGLRARLLALYDHLGPYPDARETLERLRASGFKTAILSNGSPRMLRAAAESARLAHLLDALLSIEDVGVYKPHPSVYQLAVDRLGVRAKEVLFVTANGWDAHGAKAFGFHVAWCNRALQPRERLPEAPDVQIRALAELSELLSDER